MGEPSHNQSTQGPLAEYGERLMSFFYPVHYQLGMEMEQAMCQGRVDRKQSAMLWLVYSRSDEQGWARRKDIVRELSSWFEISEAKVSRMLRSLSTPPHEFLDLAESPDSSRERILRLTAEGMQFVEVMRAEAMAYLTAKVGHLSQNEFDWGLAFLAKAFGPDGSKIGELPPFAQGKTT